MENQPMDLAASVAAELRAAKARKDLTLSEMVELTGFSKSSVNNWLKGYREITMPVLDKLSRAMGTDPLEVIRAAMEQMQNER